MTRNCESLVTRIDWAVTLWAKLWFQKRDEIYIWRPSVLSAYFKPNLLQFHTVYWRKQILEYNLVLKFYRNKLFKSHHTLVMFLQILCLISTTRKHTTVISQSRSNARLSVALLLLSHSRNFSSPLLSVISWTSAWSNGKSGSLRAIVCKIQRLLTMQMQL